MNQYYVEPIANAIRILDDARYPLEYYMYYGWMGLDRYGVLGDLVTESELEAMEALKDTVNSNTTFSGNCN